MKWFFHLKKFIYSESLFVYSAQGYEIQNLQKFPYGKINFQKNAPIFSFAISALFLIRDF